MLLAAKQQILLYNYVFCYLSVCDVCVHAVDVS